MSQIDYGLQGSHAIVAGADGDMGRAIARALADQGVNIALVGREQFKDQTSALAKELRSSKNIEASGWIVDFEDTDQLFTTVRDIAEQSAGEVSLLVNNLIVEDKLDFFDTPVESWDSQFRYMARAPFFLSQAVGRNMVAAAIPGAIVNVGSVAGKVFWPRTAAYNAARGALIATTSTLALDLAPLNVRVNGIAAGHVETEMETDRLKQPGVREQTLLELPIGRMGIPEDVANVVLFLLSRGSDYIIGQTVVVDGGYVLR